MAKKWHNKNLPGALHFITGNVDSRRRIFLNADYCKGFLEEIQDLRLNMLCKVIAFVLMPDHFHFIANPQDGDIQTATGRLKSFSAKRIVKIAPASSFWNGSENQVWQESFKSLPLWSGWMIEQKINYIHANPVKANLCATAEEYKWTSFRSFYRDEIDPLFAIDRNWWRDDDEEKLVEAMKEWEDEKMQKLLEAIRRNQSRLGKSG